MNSGSSVLIGGIQRFSTEDGPGIRTTVFFKGCPLSCQWCHNPELQDFRQEIITLPSRCIGCGSCVQKCKQKALSLVDNKIKFNPKLCIRCFKCAEMCYSEALQVVGKWMKIDEVMTEIEKDRTFYEHTGGGVTFSGGELLAQGSIVLELIKACKIRGIPVALDTSGFGDWSVLRSLADSCQLILYDIKHFNTLKHKKFTGISNKTILNNLANLANNPETRKKVLIRLPLIEKVNDDLENLRNNCLYLKRLELKRITFIQYHKLGESKYSRLGRDDIRRFEPPTEGRLRDIIDLFASENMNIENLE